MRAHPFLQEMKLDKKSHFVVEFGLYGVFFTPQPDHSIRWIPLSLRRRSESISVILILLHFESLEKTV